MADFIYEKPFQIGEDSTEYRLISSDHTKLKKIKGREILHVNPEGLELLAREAINDVSFLMRSSHLEKLKKILDDPEATDNDKFVAYVMLKNQVIAAEGELPSCQDTGTAVVIAKKGEDVYTGADDAKYLSRGIYDIYKNKIKPDNNFFSAIDSKIKFFSKKYGIENKLI